MSNIIGLSMAIGKTSLPATFEGTLQLLDGNSPPVAPGPNQRNVLMGEFHATIDITFDLLLSLGFVPVGPAHPSYPLYLRARDAHQHDHAASGASRRASHGHHVVRLPYQTTIMIEPEMSLRYGLVPPGRAHHDRPAP